MRLFKFVWLCPMSEETTTLFVVAETFLAAYTKWRGHLYWEKTDGFSNLQPLSVETVCEEHQLLQ